MFDKLSQRIVSFIAAAALTMSNITSVHAADITTSTTTSETDVETTTISEETDLTYQVIELYPDEEEDEKSVTLNGLMPDGAEATVIDVSDTHDGVAAYDITITDGQLEFQPSEENPIKVEIVDPAITENIELWHIHDDGTREQIVDFTAEDGKVSFYATGFSVYEIVDGPEPYTARYATTIEELVADETAFLISYGDPPNYATNRLNNNSAFIETQNVNAAASWYFEKRTDENSVAHYYIYTYDGTIKKYLTNPSGNLAGLETIADGATPSTEFEFSPKNKAFYIKIKNVGKWLQHSGGGSGYRFWTDNNNATNSQIKAAYTSSIVMPDDPYELDGKTYALMEYNGGNVGNGFYADENSNPASVEMLSWVVRTKNSDNTYTSHTYYVADDIDLLTWTFHSINNDNYSLSATVNGETKYLHINENDSVTFENTPQAIQVTPDNKKSIMLSVGNKALTFQAGSGDDPDLFTAAEKNNQYLKLVDPSDLQNNDYVTYTSKKISASDINDGDEVLIYTRVWTGNKYEFYALDADGHLYPCYERGDNIMWVGGRIDTLLWEFTEYTNDDGTPNYYYELYNPYSKKFIAPDRSLDRVLSDSKIGINMPGRKTGEYYTDILAWDDPSYSYSGLGSQFNGSENSVAIPTTRQLAETFYFAKIVDPTTSLTEVETIDNNQFGITMRMVDWDTRATESNFLGSNSGGAVTTVDNNLLSTNLGTDGYPTTARENSTLTGYVKGKSLKVLYDNANGTYGARDVNHLFIKSIYDATGYFEFDSCQNTATLRPYGGPIQNDFVVYKELATDNVSSLHSHDHGQFYPYNYILPGVYSTIHPQNLYDALVNELSPSDPRKYEKLHKLQTDDTPNCYNGMELTASFTQTPNGKDDWGHDIIFEFTGDDDFWLYVDGELLIDLGGIHSALAGNVNFATGTVVVNNGTPTTIRDVCIENYKKRNPNATNTEIENFLRDKHFGEISGAAADAAPEEKFEPIFDDYTKHTMRIFYMERGAGASNLHMRFNLSYVTPGNVILNKDVSGTDDLDFESVEYPFQIIYRIKGENDIHYLGDTTDSSQNQYIFITYQNSTKEVECIQKYTPPGVNPADPPDNVHTFQSVFFINPINTAEIHFPENTYEYQIVECGMNTEVYDQTRINGVIPLDKNDPNYNSTKPEKVIVGNRTNYKSAWTTVEEQSSVSFDNHVNPEGLRTLSFTKKLYDGDYVKTMTPEEKAEHKLTAEEDPTKFAFRLYLSNGVTEDIPLAYMVKYRVLDPEGYYCRWDITTQNFVRYQYGDNAGDTIKGKTVLDDLLDVIANDPNLSAEQKAAKKEALLGPMTFESSMNGQISKIPAWYTVEVPNLPVGTKFRVEERDADTERPLGYDRVEYEREAGTYHTEEGEKPDIGTIHKQESPVMSVINQRGFEIQATKIWSDSDFTKSHDDVYTALYVGDLVNGELTNLSLVAGSVRKLSSNQKTVRHFMPSLPSGRTLANYAVYEVELTNPVEDPEGNITYYSIHRLDSGVPTVVAATPKVPDNAGAQNYTYNVSYEQGEIISSVHGSDNLNNVRKDIISNDRGGGVVISLYDMASKTSEKKVPLANGVFKLMQGDTLIGTYHSNANGKITIMYDFTYDTEYTITQISAPEHYIGLPEPIPFTLSQTQNDNQTVYSVDFNDNLDNNWKDWETHNNTDEIVAYINVYNMRFTLKAVKIEKQNDPGANEEPKKLSGAVFALYRGQKGIGGYVKDIDPIPNYESLTTDENGIIPQINNTLEVGRYYLEEVRSPNGYKKLEHDIIFQITDNDIILHSISPDITLTKTSTNNVYDCEIIIENELDQQDFYFDIEKNIFVDKNIHSSDPKQKFVFKVLRFNEGTADNDLTVNNAQECFYVTLNCNNQLSNYPYADALPSTGKNTYDASNHKVSVSYGSNEIYTFPTAVYNSRKIIHVTQPGIYLVSEVESWSSTDYDFWVGSNTYQGYEDGGTSANMGRAVKMIVNSKNMEYDKNSAKTDRPTASFANSETEYAYLSSQAYAENTIKHGN